MKNLLDDIDLARGASEQERNEALLRMPTRDNDVLSDPQRFDHYERVHLQYEAIAAACDLLARDTHRWSERSVEFLPHAEDPL